MKAINLSRQGSSPAPSAWKVIPEIKACRPSPIGQDVSLQLIDGTKNICVWMVSRSGGVWDIASDFFLVKAITPLKLKTSSVNHHENSK